jgi:hypothetical protein
MQSNETFRFVFSILWRPRCRSTVNSGNACLQPLLSKATMEGTVVFFGVRSGNDVIQQQRNRRRCFLCGLSTAMMGQFRVSYERVPSSPEAVPAEWLQSGPQPSCWQLAEEWRLRQEKTELWNTGWGAVASLVLWSTVVSCKVCKL